MGYILNALPNNCLLVDNCEIRDVDLSSHRIIMISLVRPVVTKKEILDREVCFSQLSIFLFPTVENSENIAVVVWEDAPKCPYENYFFIEKKCGNAEVPYYTT